MKRSPSWLKQALIGLLVYNLVFCPALIMAGERLTGVLRPGQSISAFRSLPAVNTTELPVLLDTNNPGDGVERIDYTDDGETSSMTVHQDEERASLDWESFNVGENAEVYFDQNGNANWYALNRIYDANPSQIFGQLSADGKVYLINQNGMLFGANSQVRNLHTLVASTLNIAEEDFEAGNLNFSQEDYRSQQIDDPDYLYDPSLSFVENQGEIITQTGGAVFMLAPNVENSGVIHAPTGQVALVAGDDATLFESGGSSSRTERMVRVQQNPGTVTNRGAITADQGVAGMYGGVVNQEGLIRSVTAVYKNGVIELQASERITTTEGSYTGCPLSDSEDSVDSSFESNKGSVQLSALEIDRSSMDVPTYDYPEVVAHNGTIEAPSGNVVLEAEERVFLGDNSSIDVSGAWADASASENEIEVQLNSVELSDEFLARQGEIKGDTIYVNALNGTDIGHISGYLNLQEEDVARRSTQGGTVDLRARGDNGEVIVKQGARIDFSGGGIRYAAGQVQTSRVAIGDAEYDIADIPDEVLRNADELVLVDPSQQRAASQSYIPAYIEGSDAGTLTVNAGRTVVLDGSLNGSVTVGRYQTLSADPSTTIGDITYQTARGHREPLAGTLKIVRSDASSDETTDRGIGDLVIRSSGVALADDFGVDDLLPDETTYLSADMLNDAGLGSLALFANQSIVTEADTTLNLAASHNQGSLIMVARRILHQGEIIMPGGTVILNNDYNITNVDGVTEVADGLWLAAGSSIDVSGETIDQWRATTIDNVPTHLEGGTIELIGNDYIIREDYDSRSAGVFVDASASLDVSGGYLVNTRREVTGGNAGSLEVWGKNVDLSGRLSGHSLLGYKGGDISLTARSVAVYDADAGEVPSSSLALSDERLTGTGFAQIELQSYFDISVNSGAWLTPSVTKFAVSTTGANNTLTLVEPSVLDLETTSVGLTSGLRYRIGSGNEVFQIGIEEGAGIEVQHGGTIALTGAQLDIAGRLETQGGDITAKAKYGDIWIREGALLDASGYATQTVMPTSAGLPLGYEVYDAGEISLQATYGTVSVAEGSQLDVGGSEQVTNYFRNMLGRTQTYTLAGNAGAIDITGKYLDIAGTLSARTHHNDLAGGALALTSTDIDAPMVLSGQDLLTLTDPDRGNFDALSLTSMVGLAFDTGLSLTAARSLTLDAPYISAVDGQALQLYSSHVTLQNSVDKYHLVTNISNAPIDATAYYVDPVQGIGDSRMLIESQWLDISGNIALSGFDSIDLTATKDMTLDSQPGFISKDSALPSMWSGRLSTYADLMLSANRIYPHTDAVFTVTTGHVDGGNQWVGGTIYTTQAGGSASDGAILSANGELILEANTIHHGGTLLAPMGRLVLSGQGQDSQITLAAGSTLASTGNAPVVWGTYSGDQWSRVDKTNSSGYTTILVDGAPDTGILLSADTADMEEDALVDGSGGGLVYASEFQPSISGSADPLAQPDRYVIVLDNSVQLPGEGIYIPNGYGVPEGNYTILPESYAFLPNAYIVEDLGTVVDPSQISTTTLEGYTQVAGYFSTSEGRRTSLETHAFSVRTADDVLSEGLYSGDMAVAGNGGQVNVSAASASLEGRLQGSGLDGYYGGSLRLGADHIIFSSLTREAWQAQNPGEDLENKLFLQTDGLDESGFAAVGLGSFTDREAVGELVGDFASTFSLLANDAGEEADAGHNTPFYTLNSERSAQTLTISDNAVVNVDALGLYVQDTISIGTGAQIRANEVLMSNLAGEVQLAEGASIEANVLGIFAQTLDSRADFNISQSLAIGSNNTIALTGEGVPMEGQDWFGSMQINAATCQQFAETANVALASSSGLAAIGQVNVQAGEMLYINTPQISGMAHNDDHSAAFQANNIIMTNTNAAGGDPEASATGSLDLSAGEDLWVGPGSMTLSGFNALALTAGRDLALAGQGELRAAGDLTLTAGRVTTGTATDADGGYQSADYTVDAGEHQLTILSSGQAANTTHTPGGRLTLQGGSIINAGTIDNFGGDIALIAQNGIVLQSGSQIQAQGGILTYDVADNTIQQAYQAGRIHLDSGSGAFTLEEGARIDVANTATAVPDNIDTQTWGGWVAAGYLDAGQVDIQAQGAEAVFGGEIAGASSYGLGGSFALSAGTLAFSEISRRLTEGGLNNTISMQAANGNIIVAQDDYLSARQITLIADNVDDSDGNGRIEVYGTLDVSGHEDDRRIELMAKNQINLYKGSVLDARGVGSQADGGEVFVSSADAITFNAGDALLPEAAIHVDGDGGGQGGTVLFRSAAYDSDTDGILDNVRLSMGHTSPDATITRGIITGARRIGVEAVVHHDISATPTITSAMTSTWQTELTDYMANFGGAITSELIAYLNADGSSADALVLIPGLEIVSSGDINLNTAWELSADNGWRYGSGTPGMLTLRAAGDLNLNANLLDQPHSDVELLSENQFNLYDSWGLTLTAGARLDSANPLAVDMGAGSLNMADGTVIYTESNTIQIAAGRDVNIGRGYYDTRRSNMGTNQLSYSIATHDGSIDVYAGNDLRMAADTRGLAPAIQAHTGDIAIQAAGDIDMGLNSAIRTTGWLDLPDIELLSTYYPFLSDPAYAYPDSGYATRWEAYLAGYEQAVTDVTPFLNQLAFNRYADFSGGGDLTIEAGGLIQSASVANDIYTRYDIGRTSIYDAPTGGASYTYSRGGGSPSAGIVAMAGGDVSVSAGQGLSDVPLAAYGIGDMTITAGGDADGRYLIEDGRASIMAMQNFGAQSPDRAIEIIDNSGNPSVDVRVVAQGDIDLGTAINPLMALLASGRTAERVSFFQYTEESQLNLVTPTGNVTLAGQSQFHEIDSIARNALPATVSLVAGADITFDNDQAFWLLPSSSGNLAMTAGGDIIGTKINTRGERDYNQIVVSNLYPEQVYSHLTLPGMEFSQLMLDDLSMTVYDDENGFLTEYIGTFEQWWETQDTDTQQNYQALHERIYNPTPLHSGDAEPIQIIAGGDITNLALSLPEQAVIEADGSIADFYFRIQHNHDTDISVLSAGNAIELSPLPTIYSYLGDNQRTTYDIYLRRTGVELAGQGALMVSAGNDIDLGLSQGIRSVGNFFNSDLSGDGADIIMSSGYDAQMLLADDQGGWQTGTVGTFFDELRDGGTNYSALKYGERNVEGEPVATDIEWVRGLGDAYAQRLLAYDAYENVPGDLRDELAAMYLDQISSEIIAPVLVATNARDNASQEALASAGADYAADIVQGVDFRHVAQHGEINMTQSQVYTQQSGNIYIAAASDFNVGVTAFSEEKSNSGVNTMKGGGINIFTEKDLNVDESRVMTWYGGDITLWSNSGNINAGKGSKTTVSVSDPVKKYDSATDSYYLEYTLPAVGSGIRLLTYDPDGTTGSRLAPAPGDGYFFAPKGEIDAGEAGIVGAGNILLAAAVLTNTQNIDIAGISIGADLNQDAGAGISNMTGSGAASATDSMANDDMALASAKDRFKDYVSNISDSLVPRWLAVEVVGFDQEEDADDDEDQEK